MLTSLRTFQTPLEKKKARDTCLKSLPDSLDVRYFMAEKMTCCLYVLALAPEEQALNKPVIAAIEPTNPRFSKSQYVVESK